MMKLNFSKLLTASKILLVMLTVVTAGVSLEHLTYAATGSLTLSPASGSYTVGNTFTVNVVENSGTDAVNTIDAYINFPPSLLQFVSDTTVAPFSFNPAGSDTAGSGSLAVTRSQLGTSSTSGQTVTTVTFKVLAAGTATVSFNSSSSDILTASSPSSNVLTSSPSGSYTLSNASSGGGGTGGGGSGSTGSGSTSTPAPAVPSSTTKSTSVSIKPKSSSSSVTVPNNGNVAVNTPVSVQPTTVQTDGVKKVEYYLGGKLVDTETKAPYKYSIDTTNLKNGTYQLVSKTYYTNGTVKKATQHLVVKNTASHTSTWLYLLVISIIILVVVGANLFSPHDGPLHRLLFRRNAGLPLSHAGGGSSGMIIGGPTVADLSPHHEPEPTVSLAPAPPVSIPVQHDAPDSVDEHLSHLPTTPTSDPGTVITPDKK